MARDFPRAVWTGAIARQLHAAGPRILSRAGGMMT